MTDDAAHSSDEEMEKPRETSMEAAALARKRRLLAMKSKMHGVEMKEEDYVEDAKSTKKSKNEEKSFRSYQPVSEVLNKVEGVLNDQKFLENEIHTHLADTMDTTAVDTVDITTLAPRKMDWDLKRDVAARLEKLERRTQRAIAELIRQRLAEGKGDLATAVNHAQM